MESEFVNKQMTRCKVKDVGYSQYLQSAIFLWNKHSKADDLSCHYCSCELFILELTLQTLEEERGKELAEKDKSVFEELAEKAQLNEKEANRIVKKHRANVTAYEGMYSARILKAYVLTGKLQQFLCFF